MLREASAAVNIEGSRGPTWDSTMDWREVDRALRDLARRRAQLDTEEARWLREADRLQIWRPLGMVSALDYCERVLGYAPHTGKERLRVARALGELPVLTEAFARGELAFSAVRELTRVATPATEQRWRDAAQGKNLREIEELVSGHERGDDPDDPPDPKVRTHDVHLSLNAEAYARWRQVRAVLSNERGAYVDDDQLVELLCDAVLERESTTVHGGESTGRAKYQIAVTVCPRCDRATQEGGGVQVPIDAAALERARCDAQHIGSLDGELPERASQDIPPSVVRFVWRRDGGCCSTPGCRSSIGLEVHHFRPRADGGSHHPSNLGLFCSACHMAIHKGTLVLERGADGGLVATRPAEVRQASDANSFEATALRAQARDALVGMGWKSAIARAAVDEAWSHVGPRTTIETLVHESLRRCPRPTQ